MIFYLVIVLISILNVTNGFLIYKPDEGTYPNGTAKPVLFFKFQTPSKLDCNVTNTKTYKLHPEKFNCNQNFSWHFEYIKTAYENSTSNKCEEMNVISLVSKKYIIPVNAKLMKPILIRTMKQRRSCGKGYMEGLNFFSYKLNNINNIWSKSNISPSILITDQYPDSIAVTNEEVMYNQMYMFGLQIGSLNLTFPPNLEIAKEMLANGTLKTIDDFKVVVQDTMTSVGNSIFKKSCEVYNDVLDLIDSKEDITEVMAAYLNRKDITAERIDKSVRVRQCKLLEPETVKLIPLN
uniref:Uncharacterized protein n=1 Tax=Rhabditophanes sp. KR3021 TaxID=114890 RepID=A0AC35TMX1_9BILA